MDQGDRAKARVKSPRELAWEKFMLRVLSLEPGSTYSILVVIDKDDGILLGSIENRGKVERWG